MTNTVDTFRALHIPGDPLVLYNIWDAGSARVVAEAGAKAIATGSYGVAEANGYRDGETLPLGVALENLRRILTVTELPVTIDMEAGYGATPAEVGVSVGKAFDLGAAGINMEDRMPGATELLPVADAAERVTAAAATGIHVNARTDVYLGVDPADYSRDLIDAVLQRASAYAEAGAGSLFVPFLGDHSTINAICEASPLPVNVLWAPGRGSVAELAKLGVARISYGHQPWSWAMEKLGADARAIHAG
tara:strand:- start:1040 stop:1783 length:744 start_codon:yes stop_codon:yes gene_type:complete